MFLRQALISELPKIWEILQQAIEQRKQDGSEQWQDGYPNEKTVLDDITNGHGYVLIDNNLIIAYSAIIFGVEEAYNEIKGKWLGHGDYVVVHRIAILNAMKGKGIATKLLSLIEDLSIKNNVFSIKIDTNFDNVPMLKILNKLNYAYCGEVFFRGSPRKAFEKLIQ